MRKYLFLKFQFLLRSLVCNPSLGMSEVVRRIERAYGKSGTSLVTEEDLESEGRLLSITSTKDFRESLDCTTPR